jgi:molybdate transport system permease protein
MWLLVIPGVLLIVLLAVPILALLLESTETDIVVLLGDPVVQSALWLSLFTSAAATGVSVLLGAPLAFLLARLRFRGRNLLEMIVDLPIVLPPSVAGLALLLAFGRRGLLGESLGVAGISLPFTTVAVVLAQVFVAGPLFVRAARIGFGSLDKNLEEADHWQLFRHVMVPGARNALLGGMLLCWARALGEFGATLLFAGNLMGRTQTMPLAIYVSLESNRGAAIALSVILLVFSAVLLALLRRYERNWQTN